MEKNSRRAEKILLLRHAEKPDSENRGVTQKGRRDKQSLTVRGWQRAGALCRLLAPANNFIVNSETGLGSPRFIYASKPRKHHGSRRCLQTVMPLAEKLDIEVNSQFSRDETAEMLSDAFGCDGVVLICWQREFIPQIANLILGDDALAPHEWDEDRFDLLWVFEKNPLTSRYDFKQVPQNLLAGDKNSPIR